MHRLARRHFIASCAWALGSSAWAEERIYRVGYLSWQDEGSYYDATLRGFLEGLRSEGFAEGKNLQLIRRSASNNADRFKPLANDLARIPVDLYFAPATRDGHGGVVRRQEDADRHRHDHGSGGAEVRELAGAAGHARDRRHHDEPGAHGQAPAAADGGGAGPEAGGRGDRRGDARRLLAGDGPCAEGGQAARRDDRRRAHRPARAARRGRSRSSSMPRCRR